MADYKKHLKLNENYDWVDAKEKVKSKAKPREIDNEWIKGYWLLRDRVIYKTADEESKQQILNRYNKL